MGRLIDADKFLSKIIYRTDVDSNIKDFVVGAIADAPTVDAVPLGVEMWMNRFDIKTRFWKTADGKVSEESFIITRAEEV